MMPRWLALLVKIGFTAALFFILLLRIHPGSIIAALNAFSGLSLAAAALLVTLQAFAAAIRWHLLLRLLGQPVKIVRALQLFWLGMFFAAVLPGAIVGDGARIWMLHRDNVSVATAFSSVLLDRVIGLLGLVLLLSFCIPFATDIAPDAFIRWAAAGVLGIGTLLLLLIPAVLRLPRWLAHNRFASRLQFLRTDLRAVFRSGGALATLFAISVLAMFLNALAFYLLVRGISADVHVADAIVLALVVILSLILPISIGGWGIREIATVILFGEIGISSSAAVAVSLVIGIIGIAVSLPGGLIWLKEAKIAKPLERSPQTVKARDMHETSQ